MQSNYKLFIIIIIIIFSFYSISLRSTITFFVSPNICLDLLRRYNLFGICPHRDLLDLMDLLFGDAIFVDPCIHHAYDTVELYC